MGSLKPKPIYDILFKLLAKEFAKDFTELRLCSAEDKILYDLNEDMLRELYDKWLIDEGYIEYTEN